MIKLLCNNIAFSVLVAYAVLGATVCVGGLFCSYDPLHRLTCVDYGNGASIQYTYDAAGNRLTLAAQATPPSDHIAPTVQITRPTTERLYVTTGSSVTLSGTAYDASTLSTLSCTNGAGASVSVAGTTSWSAGPVSLSNGINKITISAADPSGNIGNASLTVVVLPPAGGSNVVFQDDFNDNAIDPAKWTNWGSTVTESTQIMQVLQNVTDAGGNLMTKPIPINTNGTITITRNVKLHYSQNYFIATTDLNFGDLPKVCIKYGNMDYDSPPEKAVHGFYICRNNANPHDVSCNTNDVSSWISPIWDTWFKETIAYNPQSGNLAYSINDTLQRTFNVGTMPITNGSPSLVMYFNSWGWWTGYQHLFDNLEVTQETTGPAPESRDFDSDGMPDWAEILAGTSPTNAASRLVVATASPSSNDPSSFVVQWASVSGTLYSVNRSTNLLAPSAFLPLKTNILGQPVTTIFTDTNAPMPGPSFYRITVDY